MAVADDVHLRLTRLPPAVSVPMLYWRHTYFQSLSNIGAQAQCVPEWVEYATYCADLERGLRRQAFDALHRFIARMEAASFAERKRFISWLLVRADGRDGEHMLVPHPLRKRLVEPTCTEWIEGEPESSEPHRWLGFYDHLKLALQLDPTDEIAARKFINTILADTQYATHELPAGFLGDPLECLKILDEAGAALPGLLDAAERNQCASDIDADRKLIREYLAATGGM